MARLIFQKTLKTASEKGIIPESSRKAIRWFRRKARGIRTTPRDVLSEQERWKRTTIKRRLLGNMYFFIYDPVGKNTLPYWDTFPLVIPIELTNDGFIGLNFHYLDWRFRAILMDRLNELKRDEPDLMDKSKQSQAGKLDWRKIQYRRLSSLSRYKYFRPCLKRYKFANIKSRLIQVEKPEWDIALFLPLEKFQNQSGRSPGLSKIWNDSKDAF
jgi:hypothetical protein